MRHNTCYEEENAINKKLKEIKKRLLKETDVERLDKIFARHSDNVCYKLVDENAVILNLENNSYFFLNEVGTQIWQSLREDKSLSQIAKEIAQFFNVSRKKVTHDLIELVNELVDADLLELKNDTI